MLRCVRPRSSRTARCLQYNRQWNKIPITTRRLATGPAQERPAVDVHGYKDKQDKKNINGDHNSKASTRRSIAQQDTVLEKHSPSDSGRVRLAKKDPENEGKAFEDNGRSKWWAGASQTLMSEDATFGKQTVAGSGYGQTPIPGDKNNYSKDEGAIESRGSHENGQDVVFTRRVATGSRLGSSMDDKFHIFKDRRGPGTGSNKDVGPEGALQQLDFAAFTEDLSQVVDTPEPQPAHTPAADFNFKPLDWGWAHSNLPASPLMNPITLKDKDKIHLSTFRPTTWPRSPFQRQLEKSPYAMALATPVRLCQVTGVHLPRFFLQGFRLLGHPDNGEPYYVPRSWYTGGAKMSGMVGGFVSGGGPGMYTLARYPLLAAMSSKHGGFGQHPYRKLIPNRMKQKPVALGMFYKAKFRSDMHGFILHLARRRLMESMLYLMGRRRGYLTGLNTWEESKRRPQTGAFFWLGEKSENRGDDEGPPEFATIDLPRDSGRIRKVPVYNLRVLLGDRNLEQLRLEVAPSAKRPQGFEGMATRSLFDCPIIAVNHRNSTAYLELSFWWLQGYLAQHKEYIGSQDPQIEES